MSDTKLSKAEYYAQKLNRLFWYGIALALPTEFAAILLMSAFDNAFGTLLVVVLQVTVCVLVLLGLAGILLAVWARFTTGYRHKISHHIWAGVVLVVFFLLAYFAGQVHQQMQHRQRVQAAWVQAPVCELGGAVMTFSEEDR